MGTVPFCSQSRPSPPLPTTHRPDQSALREEGVLLRDDHRRPRDGEARRGGQGQRVRHRRHSRTPHGVAKDHLPVGHRRAEGERALRARYGGGERGKRYYSSMILMFSIMYEGVGGYGGGTRSAISSFINVTSQAFGFGVCFEYRTATNENKLPAPDTTAAADVDAADAAGTRKIKSKKHHVLFFLRYLLLPSMRLIGSLHCTDGIA